MAYKRVTPPSDVVVTVEEAKARLRIDFDDDDDLIDAFIRAATDYLEGPRGYLGRALLDQTWDLYLDAFPGCQPPWGGWDRRRRPSGGNDRTNSAAEVIEIGLPPLIEVLGVFYLDNDGAEHEMDTAAYMVDAASEPGRIAPVSSWPTTGNRLNSVRVRFRAGYLDQTDSPAVDAVPDDIKTGLLLLVGDMNKHRDSSVDGTTTISLPMSAEYVLSRYRVHRGFA